MRRAEEGAAYFAEHIGFGPGVWDGVFSAEQRATMVTNADTWLDQSRDPRRLSLSLDDLATTDVPVLITRATAAPRSTVRRSTGCWQRPRTCPA